MEFHYIRHVQRSDLFRAFAFLVGLWFSTAFPLSAAVHDCPLHGSHAGHAMHQMAGMHDGGKHVPAQAPANTHHTACTCMGSCCCGAPAAAPANGVETFFPAIGAAVASRNCGRVIASRREHALPFSNGPPVLVS